MVTVFKSITDTKSPKYTTLEAVKDGILSPRQIIVDTINQMRCSDDEAEIKALKNSLPPILFSGKFTERKDSALIEHSGYAVVDFDKVPDVDELKDKLKLIPYIALAFTSPTGTGVKAVAKIPVSKDGHRKNYKYLLEKLAEALGLDEKYFDPTSINESRACYISYDPELYYNANPSTLVPPREVTVVQSDYSKIDVAVKMIRLAPDGQKHAELLKAARLLGGYISGGTVDEFMAINVLETEIKARNIDDFEQAKRTIRDGIAYGKQAPIYEIEGYEQEARLKVMKVKYRSHGRRYEFLTDPEDDSDGLSRYRSGDFKMGMPTGHYELDKYFLFKEGDFNTIIGFPNSGKSWFIWWLAMIAAKKYGWRWIFFTSENKTRQVKKKLIEFYCDCHIQEIGDEEYEYAKQWVDDMFTFIRTDRDYSAYDLLNFAEILMDEKEYKGFLIDPYNSLSIDKAAWKDSGSNRHEYDFAVSTEFVKFTDKYNISIWMCAHPVTEAMRKRHSHGHLFAGQPMPPEASDIEGGAKFLNRTTGFFMVIHRYIYSETDWRYTRVEVKKVKDVETGGKPTKYDEPIQFELNDYMTHFTERDNNFNPLNPNYELPEFDGR